MTTKLWALELSIEDDDVNGFSTMSSRFDEKRKEWVNSVTIAAKDVRIELDEETLLRALAVIETEKKLRNSK